MTNQLFSVFRDEPGKKSVNVTFSMPVALAFVMLIIDSVEHPEASYRVKRQYGIAGTHLYYSVKPGWLQNKATIFDEIEKCELSAYDVVKYEEARN